jgi:hypothetical protein
MNIACISILSDRGFCVLKILIQHSIGIHTYIIQKKPINQDFFMIFLLFLYFFLILPLCYPKIMNKKNANKQKKLTFPIFSIFSHKKRSLFTEASLSFTSLIFSLEIICPAEELRRPSISSDRPFQRLYRQHIF